MPAPLRVIPGGGQAPLPGAPWLKAGAIVQMAIGALGFWSSLRGLADVAAAPAMTPALLLWATASGALVVSGVFLFRRHRWAYLGSTALAIACALFGLWSRAPAAVVIGAALGGLLYLGRSALRPPAPRSRRSVSS